jgi:tetratricopeptide (TPR) repeat protein
MALNSEECTVAMRYAACLSCLLLLLVAACGSGDSADVTEDKEPVHTANNNNQDNTDRPGAMTGRRAAELFERAGDKIDTNRHAAALPLIERAVELAPDNGQYHSRLGDVLIELRHFARAHEAFLRAAEIETGSTRVQMLSRAAFASHQLAREAFREGEHEQALDFIRNSLELQPASGDAWLLKGDALFTLDNNNAAAKAFSNAADMLPGARRNLALYKMAQAHHANHEFAKAEVGYTRAIELGYTEGDIYGWRAQARMALGRRDEAIQDLRLAITHATSIQARREFEADLADLLGSDE